MKLNLFGQADVDTTLVIQINLVTFLVTLNSYRL
jgi:hypothetical protein